MCVLLLIGLFPLALLFSPVIAIVIGIHGFAISLQKKKEKAGIADLSEAGKQRVAGQLALFFLISLGAFLTFLLVRYWTT